MAKDPLDIEKAAAELRAELKSLPVDVPISFTDGKLTEASKERIKLRSQYANGIAVSLFAVGVLGPVVAIIGTQAASHPQTMALAATALVCFVLSVVLHLYAVENLGELDQ